jgi:hypothetical protein
MVGGVPWFGLPESRCVSDASLAQLRKAVKTDWLECRLAGSFRLGVVRSDSCGARSRGFLRGQ